MHMPVPFVLTMVLLSRNPLEAYIFGKLEPEKTGYSEEPKRTQIQTMKLGGIIWRDYLAGLFDLRSTQIVIKAVSLVCRECRE